MRIIPGNTKVQIEIFRGVTLWDMLVGAISAIMLALIISSTLPVKLLFICVHLLITVLLLARFDKEANYMYLIHILRHFGFKRRYDRMQSDKVLLDKAERGENAVAMDDIFPEENPGEDAGTEEELFPETKAERKARLKAEKAERKADDKLLKSKTLTKEEEDAIWLKRAQQSQEKKKKKQTSRQNKQTWAEMEELSSFTGIKDGFIEFGNKYYGAALEIQSVEFRFFSEYRRNNAIENGLGSVLRSVRGDYSMNLVKIERPVEYDGYVNNEFAKIEALRKSYEEGFLSDEELKARLAIVYDRIEELNEFKSQRKVVIPFYYLVMFDSDKQQLNNAVQNAIDTLKIGETTATRLNDKQLAVFLKYTNSLDFDEHEIDKINPEDYATWAMPQTVEFVHRTAQINGIATHNFRVVSYPTMVWDAWLASLMTYPSIKVMVKMKPMDSGKAISAIDHSLSELRGKVSSARTDSEALEAQNHLETLQLLLGTLQSDNEQLMDVNIYVTAYDVVYTEENPKLDNIEYESFRARINNMKKATRRAWNEAGFRLNAMEFNQAVAYIGSQVSGYDPMAKDGRGIPTNTLAATFPWVFPFVKDPEGIKLGASDGVPVFVDFFRRDSERVNSNMVIVGKSGSGKSFATKTLLTNLAADDAKIFILDPEDEYTELARNLHGKFINVANAQYGRLNPFHIITNLDDDEEGSATSSYATHLQFLEEFFKQILPDCDRDSLEYLNALVDRVYGSKGIDSSADLSVLRPEDYPTFDDLYDEILREFQRTDNEYIRTMLRTLMNYISKFSEGGRNSVIWNGPSSITTEENFTVFNFQSLLANRNTTIANAQMLLVLKYIDNEIIKNRDYNEKYNLNRKIVVVIDEAHVFIDTKFPVALDFMFQLAKRIRKYNGMQIVITQNIKDFVGSEEIARKSTAIINACQYSFIFSLAPNDMGDLCTLYEKAGGINENEQEQIVQAPRGQAFTIMSPNSRTSFKITTPDDVRRLFSKRDYVNPYFTGEGWEENWAEFLGDSGEKRAENLAARSKGKLIETAEETEDISFVKFNEVTEEELRQQELDKAMSSLNFSEVTDDFEIPEIPETPEEFKATNVLLSPREPEPAPVSTKTEELLAELTLKLGSDMITEEIKRVVREEIERAAAFNAGALAGLGGAVGGAVGGIASAAGSVAGSAIGAAADLGEKAFDFGGDLMSDISGFGIGSDAAEDEVDLSADLSEDLFAGSDTEEEVSSSDNLFSFGGGDSGEESSADDFFSFGNLDDSADDDEDDGGAVLGSIFDFAGIGGGISAEDIDENKINSALYGEDGGDDDADAEDDFDIMAFLAKQADDVEIGTEEDDLTVEEFINSPDTVLDITLEQLTSYIKKAK